MFIRIFCIIAAMMVLRFVFINGDVLTVKNVIQFPYHEPFQGIFLALALPLDLPDINVFVAYNFEATYKLPENQTTFTFPPLIGGSEVDRQLTYNAFEYKLTALGFPGKECVLRAICEAVNYSSKGTGILGDLLHIILTPSTSLNTQLANEYNEAEINGRKIRNCKKYKCNISLLSLISKIENIF